ncbi:MAG: alpha-ribazole phosphatase [Clostridia bacterium]|nr:alpha-ribazole phosphatase [Clostridia bacterium]
MDQKTIYLVRHGKIKTDTQRCYIGQIDLPLTGEGFQQAKALSNKLGRLKIEAVYSSDLSRSRDTAKEIALKHGLIPQERADLREISLGKWEGVTFAEVSTRYPEEFKRRGEDIGYFRPPGGESFADCSQRIVAAFQDILKTPFQNIVIVGHAGINRVLICHVLGLPLDNLFRISQDYGCLNVIIAGKFGYRLKLLNAPVFSKETVNENQEEG